MLTWYQFSGASRVHSLHLADVLSRFQKVSSAHMFSDKIYRLQTSSATVYTFYTKTNRVSVVSGIKMEELDSMEPRTIILKLISLASVREKFREERSVNRPILCTAFMIKIAERLKSTRHGELESLLKTLHVRKELKDLVRELLRDVIEKKMRVHIPGKAC